MLHTTDSQITSMAPIMPACRQAEQSRRVSVNSGPGPTSAFLLKGLRVMGFRVLGFRV